MKALLALSDPASVESMCGALQETDLDLEFCFSLHEIRSILKREKVAMIFCQARLPDGTFRELVKFPDLWRANTAIVVCSDFYEKATYVEAMSLGAFDYATFPYRQSEVEWIVGNVLRRNAALKNQRELERSRKSVAHSAHAS